ncbi:MAG: holo-ACP synthase [Anaerolineae bacterium]|jgi:holo-[acyl-carrier protein] synthase|nr:holo-ACP synthase [Anaerolineae bacterium]MBT7989013.1 holo-ACP synthase [Anaerolineae bacterium]
MIIGIGVDLVSIEKIAESVKSEAFRRKVFTPDEIKSCEEIANAAEHYAGKFAAKEAFMKAIGKGIRQEVWFTQIEILNRESGAPYLQANGEAEKTLLMLGVKEMHISISHAEGMAVAMVVLSSNNQAL